jgi:cytochrome c5
MDNPCRECAEVAQEYREAIIDFWTNASDKTGDACGVTAKLTGCTERDAANAEEKLRPFSSQERLRPAEENQTRIVAAIYSTDCAACHGSRIPGLCITH